MLNRICVLAMLLLAVGCHRGAHGSKGGTTTTQTSSSATVWETVEDVSVSEAFPDDNFEGLPLELAPGVGGVAASRVYVWFDLTQYGCPCEVRSASLHFEDLDGAALNDPSTVTFDVHRVTSAWDPMSLTWNTQPSFDPVPLAQGVIAGETFSVDVPLDPVEVDSWIGGGYMNELGLVLIPIAPDDPDSVKTLPSLEDDGVGISLEVDYFQYAL